MRNLSAISLDEVEDNSPSNQRHKSAGRQDKAGSCAESQDERDDERERERKKADDERETMGCRKRHKQEGQRGAPAAAHMPTEDHSDGEQDQGEEYDPELVCKTVPRKQIEVHRDDAVQRS